MANTVTFTTDRPTKMIELPSFTGSEVEVYESLTVNQDRDLYDKHVDKDENKNSSGWSLLVAKVQKSIKSWNFVDQKGEKLPITVDILCTFPSKDIMIIVDLISGKKKETTDEKKSE